MRKAKRPKRGASESSLSLPKEKVLEGADLKSLVWVLFGPAGIGKTTFAADMGEPFFLYTDPGQRFVEVFKRPVEDWLSFKRYIKLLDSVEAQKRYSTIVVDTVDLLYTFCKQHIYRKRGIEHASDEEWGKGWELISDEFIAAIAQLCLLPYGVVFISHSKDIEIRGRLNRTSKIVPSLQKQALKSILPLADIIAYCGFEKGSADTKDSNRFIMFNPSETIEAKDRTGKLPDQCSLNYKEVENFLLKGGVEKSTGTTNGKNKPTTTTRRKKKKGR